jgi:hypothetical protein
MMCQPATKPDSERYRLFGQELDALRTRIFAKVGEEDVRYVKRLNWFSRGMEVAGRALIHFSFEPITFSAGVIALWIHKQLQATEIGHTALHGAYDRLPGAEGFASKRFRWDVPIDERSWHEGHNVRHHGGANVAGKDGDIHFGPARLTEQTPHRWHHRFQLPFMVAFLAPNFTFLMNLHFTGLSDAYSDNGLPSKTQDGFPPRPFSGERARRVVAGAPQVRALLPLQLRPLPGARGADVLEGVARQLARRDDARSLLRGDDLLRPRRPRYRQLPGRNQGERSRALVRDADRGHEQLRGQPAHLDPLRRSR